VISPSLSERARDLTAHGEPFVTATVVRVQRPTSAVAGSVALVRRDGSIEGFVGGQCAQQSLRVYSMKAIETGQPLLLRIMPDADGPADESATIAGEEIANDDGVVTVQNPCLSGGAIEMFLEPFLPSPRMLVAGESPIAGALLALAPHLGLEPVDVSGAIEPVGPVSGDLALVVAAHGRDELATLRAGVEAGIPYIGLVASPKRGVAVLAELREAGVEESLVARIDTPAGLDIGARTAPEIALSILARVIEVRRARDAQVGALGDAGPDLPPTAVDPICGMTVVVGDATPSLVVGDEIVYFCCEGCRDRYAHQVGDRQVGDRDPQASHIDRDPQASHSDHQPGAA
jgi:xanthine dehydrogenase accessory factor